MVENFAARKFRDFDNILVVCNGLYSRNIVWKYRKSFYIRVKIRKFCQIFPRSRSSSPQKFLHTKVGTNKVLQPKLRVVFIWRKLYTDSHWWLLFMVIISSALRASVNDWLHVHFNISTKFELPFISGTIKLLVINGTMNELLNLRRKIYRNM